MPLLAQNKKGVFNYTILEEYEAGIVLFGHEVKSLRQKHMSMKGAYVSIRPTGRNGSPEAWLLHAYISPYEKAGALSSYDPERPRKLLLRNKELKTLLGKTKTEGLTLIPLSVYTRHNRLKVRIGLGRGKTKIDKRETIKKREIGRKIREVMKI